MIFYVCWSDAAEKAKKPIPYDLPIAEYSNIANPEEFLKLSSEPVSCKAIGNIISAMPKGAGHEKPYTIHAITDPSY